MLAIVLSFGAVGLGARPASASPCCSAPICQQEEPPSACNYCHIGCVDVDDTSIVSEMVYDEAAGLCYESVDAEPTPCDGAAVSDDAQGVDAQ